MSDTLNCWKCAAALSHDKTGRISFRAYCEVCLADLHCCKNCKFYQPGRANDCQIPGTDFVADREKNNFCEDFAILGKQAASKAPDAKSRFNDLFK